MAGRDLLGVLNGIRCVLSSGTSTCYSELQRSLFNSSFQPIIASLCTQLDQRNSNESDLDLPDFSDFDDQTFNPMTSSYTSKNSNGSINSNGRRSLHTATSHRSEATADWERVKNKRVSLAFCRFM